MHEQAVEIAALLKSLRKLGGVVVDTTDSTSRVVYSVVVLEIIVVSTDTLIWSVVYSIMKSDPGNIHMGGGVMVLYSVAVVVGGRKDKNQPLPLNLSSLLLQNGRRRNLTLQSGAQEPIVPSPQMQQNLSKVGVLS